MWLTLTSSPIGGVTVEARYAGLTVLARRQVLTLLADTLINAFAVAVALASWKKKNFKGLSMTEQGGVILKRVIWNYLSFLLSLNTKSSKLAH